MTALDGSFREYLARFSEKADVRRGVALPLGTLEIDGGINFALFSRHATSVRLELFADSSDAIATTSILLDPKRNRTGDIWHVWIGGIGPGQLYNYRVDGPYQPHQGHRFNVHKLLLDPYATAITPIGAWDFAAARGEDVLASAALAAPSMTDDAASMPKCIFTPKQFDWRDDQAPRHPWSKTVIYETHVRGFTIHPSSAVHYPGSYRGLTEKIPYLVELGVTAVELMPVQEFNHTQIRGADPDTGKPLRNYWGYDPVAFFAPKASYSSAGGFGQQNIEFKEMVRLFHAAGIEVILDVVFNHTAEADQAGPTLCWRGIDNSIFYILGQDKRFYINDSGTGNTINANHPVVREFILAALRYWVVEMHVDGFRFDLASMLGRDSTGQLLNNPPLLEQIAEDPILRETKLIAEAWDAAGAYQVGSFSDCRWAEWNGRYRDDVRRFWRGDEGMLGAFASRICGSADIYANSGKGPECSVNYVTCHDGFTLNDLVSFRERHNRPNGEHGRDGVDENFSDNYGLEGYTDDPAIESIRQRQIKNFLLTLFISRGVPMLLAGDECRRRQYGNNNAYCQDNETSWYDWGDLEAHRDLARFTREMIALRNAHPILRQERFYTEQEIQWFSPEGTWPEWSRPLTRQVACLLHEEDRGLMYLMFNAGTEAISFTLPEIAKNQDWHIAADTARDGTQDKAQSGGQLERFAAQAYPMAARSSAILLARPESLRIA
jgi:glycogen operon protein